MHTVVLSGFLVTALRMGGQFAFLLAALVSLGAQTGRPGPPKPPGPETANRLADIRRKLESTKAVDVTAERALEYSRGFLANVHSCTWPSINNIFERELVRKGRLPPEKSRIVYSALISGRSRPIIF